jgi:uncharacterized phage protein gp47/JayE
VPTLEQLLQPRNQQQVLARLLAILQTKGYGPNDWIAGSEQRTLIELHAEGMAELEALRVAITRGGYLDTAEGAFLDLLGFNAYSLLRKEATFERQRFTLTCLSGFGPYNIQANQLWAGIGDLRFNNLVGGLLNPGSTLSLEFRAESTGTAYRIALGTGTTLFTPLPGVTITNDQVIEAAINRETDALFRERCRLRWAELGYGSTAAAYQSWALSADPSITKVRVLDQNPRGQGTLDVVLWGEGGLGGAAVAAANASIQQRKPLTANVAVYAASAVGISVTATIRVRSGFLAQAQSQAAAGLSALQLALPIGATVFRSAIIEALFGPHVADVALSQPAADLTLTSIQVAQFTFSPSWLEV